MLLEVGTVTVPSNALDSIAEQAELNDARTRRMFAVHKKTRKKSAAKSQAIASAGAIATNAEQSPTASPAVPTPNVLTVKKKRAAVTPKSASGSASGDPAMQSPIARAFQKTAEGEKQLQSAPTGPTPSPKRPESDGSAVNVLQVRKKRKITSTVVSPASGSASGAAPSASAGAAAASAQVVDLSGPTASAGDQQQQGPQPEQGGTAENPVEL